MRYSENQHEQMLIACACVCVCLGVHFSVIFSWSQRDLIMMILWSERKSKRWGRYNIKSPLRSDDRGNDGDHDSDTNSDNNCDHDSHNDDNNVRENNSGTIFEK